MPTRKKKPKAKRPAAKLPKASESMRAFAAMLGRELEDWPAVTTKPMFGFTAYYRAGKIFAALPKTRALLKGDAFMFKLPEPSSAQRGKLEHDARILPTEMKDAKWFAMEVLQEKDLRDALLWLNRAYEAAR